MEKLIQIYDTTLRDGNQAKGLHLSLEDKLAIAKILDNFGVPYIEGGWPNPTNPLDIEFYVRAQKINWKNARICAFGSTRRAQTSASNDAGLKYLVDSQAPVLTIFGKSWDLHVTEILRTTLAENLSMIEDSVAYLKKQGREVVYDAEHFFDGYRANPEYALKTLEAAAQGGADCIVLCDTNGGMALSWEVEEITRLVVSRVKTAVGIHPHNDTGTAVANAMAALRGGAIQIQGTFNGYGERCGNANLTTIIPNVQLKWGHKLLTAAQMEQLKAVSRAVAEIANLSEDIRQPYVGEAAFSHKGGAHIDGVMKVAQSFEHINPAEVGNTRDFIVSNQSGGALVLDKIRRMRPGAQKSDPEVQEILTKVKKLEDEGYHFEVADASFEIIARHAFGEWASLFDVISYRVIEEHRENGGLSSEGTVRLRIQDQEIYMVATGNGPVDAMAQALRKCLKPYYPELDQVALLDYKVRVLDSNKGTGAKVRVWMRFGDESQVGSEGWGTIGVSENIVEASWKALLDGLEFGLFRSRQQTWVNT